MTSPSGNPETVPSASARRADSRAPIAAAAGLTAVPAEPSPGNERESERSGAWSAKDGPDGAGNGLVRVDPVLGGLLIVAWAGELAQRRFVEFFTAEIRNWNTRTAFGVAVSRFLAWCEARGFALEQLEPVIGAAYVEQLGQEMAAPSVKQHLAALQMLFDYSNAGFVLICAVWWFSTGPAENAKRNAETFSFLCPQFEMC